MSISKVNISNDEIHQLVGSPRYAICSTEASTAAKVATIDDSSGNFTLEKGARICVKFTSANSVASPTLNVAGTGAKAIYWNGGALASSQYWQAGAVLDFVYNGTQWDLVGVAKDNNTDAKVTNTLNTTTKAYITGTTSSTTNTGTQIFDTGVYLDTTAGRLGATSATIGGATIAKGASANIIGTTKQATTVSNQLVLQQGAVFSGTAANAGLVTRGICGVSTPDNDGACNKENLYINYDSTNDYNSGRQLILQAGTAGAHYGNNLYQYAAARGDAVKGWVEAQKYVKENNSNYKNQNAFSNVVVGDTTVAADSATDTLTFVAGDNVTLTPDATNDKITIAAKVPVATSTALGGVKSGTDITVDSNGNVSVKDDSHNHIISNVDNLQSTLDAKQAKLTGTAGQVVGFDANGNAVAQNGIHTTVITIPAGRMHGDINGDGKINAIDVDLLNKYVSYGQELTDIQIECAEVNGTSPVDVGDLTIIQQFSSGFRKAADLGGEITGNWSINPNYSTEDAQFYTDIAIEGMNANCSASVIVKGQIENHLFPKVECVQGALRIYAKLCPINSLSAYVTWINEDGVSVITSEAIEEKSDIFIANFDITLFKELEDAYNAGKVVKCIQDDVLWDLIGYEYNTFIFTNRHVVPSFNFETFKFDFSSGVTLYDGMAICDSSGWSLIGTTGKLKYFPSSHSSEHASGGSDPITPDMIGAASPPTITTVTLSVSNWDSTAKTQTVTVTGILADETKQLIQVMPAPASMTAVTAAGAYCSAQGANSLTFTCSTVPTENLVFNISFQDANYV